MRQRRKLSPDLSGSKAIVLPANSIWPPEGRSDGPESPAPLDAEGEGGGILKLISLSKPSMIPTVIGQTGPILDCGDKSQLYLGSFLNLSCPSVETDLRKY